MAVRVAAVVSEVETVSRRNGLRPVRQICTDSFAKSSGGPATDGEGYDVCAR